MKNENLYSNTPITVKRTNEMNMMLSYLENKLLLNPTAIMRLGLATLYEQEKSKEGVTHE